MQPRKPYQRIDIDAANDLMTRDDVLVIDVRDAVDYAKDHIPQARHMNISNLSSILNSAAKDIPIIIYCYRGFASQEYAQTFSDFRFQEIYSLDGGFDAWLASEAAAEPPALKAIARGLPTAGKSLSGSKRPTSPSASSPT
jgi:thiosulfate/3-mercaptopyruvate sulfurtransferase